MAILYNIFGTLMRWVYEWLSSLGNEPSQISYLAFTFIIMAVVAKMISFPLTLKQGKTSQKMAEINPQLEQLKKKYGYDERILQQKTMEFYKENNVAQVGCSSCLPMLISLIILMAMYGVLREAQVYLFDNPGKMAEIHKNFFWISDLTQKDPYWFALPLFNSATQLIVQRINPQTQQAAASGGSAAKQMQMMMYMMPIIFFFVFVNFASGLLLYWAFGNVLEIVLRLLIRLFESIRNKKQVAS